MHILIATLFLNDTDFYSGTEQGTPVAVIPSASARSRTWYCRYGNNIIQQLFFSNRSPFNTAFLEISMRNALWGHPTLKTMRISVVPLNQIVGGTMRCTSFFISLFPCVNNFVMPLIRLHRVETYYSVDEKTHFCFIEANDLSFCYWKELFHILMSIGLHSGNKNFYKMRPNK